MKDSLSKKSWMIAGLSLLIVVLSACSEGRHRTPIARNSGADTDSLGDIKPTAVDTSLSKVVDESAGCLPLKNIIDKLAEDKNGSVEFYTNETQVGSGLDDNGDGFKTTTNTSVRREGFKQFPLLQTSAKGSEISTEPTLKEYFAIEKQNKCGSVVFASKQNFTIVKSDGKKVLTMINADSGEVRIYRFDPSNSGLLSVVVYKGTAAICSGSPIGFEVRQKQYLIWGNRLGKREVSKSYAKNLRIDLANASDELDEALQAAGNVTDSGDDEDSTDNGGRDDKSGDESVTTVPVVFEKSGVAEELFDSQKATQIKSNGIALSKELYDSLQSLTEKGDFRPSQCQKP